jgi:hypothetical protein
VAINKMIDFFLSPASHNFPDFCFQKMGVKYNQNSALKIKHFTALRSNA